MNEHSERHDMNCDCFLDDGLQHHHLFYCPICGTPTRNLEPTGAEIDRKFQFVAFNPYNGKRFTIPCEAKRRGDPASSEGDASGLTMPVTEDRNQKTEDSMAKSIIVFEDLVGEGGFTTKITFDPPLEKGNKLTLAQRCGLAFAADAGEMVEDVLKDDDA